MPEERDFKQDIMINRFNLDNDCEQHASRYLYWSERLMEAKEGLDRLKDKQKLQEAQKEIHYRKEPLDGMKATENSIKAMIESDDDIIDTKEQILKAQRSVYTLSAAVSAMEHRKSQLKNLVDLWTSGYFAFPGGTKGKDKSDDSAEAARKQLNKKGEE